MTDLSYALVSPVRDEDTNLRRLAECLIAQSARPSCWVIVDNGSRDDTKKVAEQLAAEHDWIRVASAPPAAFAAPGAPIVRAFERGLELVPPDVDVVVKQDADVSIEDDYFARILEAFAGDPKLGIAGGACYELQDGKWAETYVTGDHVRGASRCYRRACLEDVSPLEQRLGWDGVDELKAAVLGWKTRLLRDIPFYHHRVVGARDGARVARWIRQGAGSHYMGYRPSYVVMRAVHHSIRRPAALAMIWGYAAAAIKREPQLGDDAVRAYLRESQRLSRLPARAREALGRR